MKNYILTSILVILLSSCISRNSKSNVFNQALEQVLLEAKDSLKVGDNQLLSVKFFRESKYEPICFIKVFSSNWYASGCVDAYTKIGKTTVVLYNLKDDFYETVNKNSITFFTDTINGYKDTCLLERTYYNHIFYMIESDSVIRKDITLPKENSSYGILREPKCEITIYTPPKEQLFRWDSIDAENKVKYYRKGFKKIINNKEISNIQ